MDTPLVSIIVRTKDRPKLLRQALKSIAAQTYRPIEVVLVNDGGCDLEVEEMKTLLGDISLNYQRLEKNMGRAHAGNVGIENVKGEYVGFLDDDDEFYPEHIAALADGLSADSHYGIAYTDSYLAFHELDYSSKEYVFKKKVLFYSEDFDRDRLLFENYIPFLCLLFERDALVNFKFEEDLDTHEDWRLLALLSRRKEFLHINKITCQYNVQGDSFEDYLEGKYDIPKFASTVFERNKEYITWSSWMHFKKKLEDKIRSASSLNEHLKRETERYKNIEGMYNFLVQKMESIVDAQRAAYDRMESMADAQRAASDSMTEIHNRSAHLAEKIETLSTLQFNLYDNYAALHSKLDHDISTPSPLSSIARKMEMIDNRLDEVVHLQAEMMNRLSVTERIRNLMHKVKGSFSSKR